MKTTLEIADDLFGRVRLVLSGKHLDRPKKLPPLVTFGGGGPTEEFKDWNWDRIRDEICQGRGGISELWSADRDFSAFPQINVRNPWVKK